jgi:Arc/MetJ family transcription regulator
MHMRTTLNLDDELLEKARRLSGLGEKTAVLHAGLQALIAQQSARRLAALGGSQTRLRPINRRRPRRKRAR